MNLYLGITDTNWYNYLRQAASEDINFWQPGGHSSFKVLERGAPFLFKLKYPMNAIGGVGFFVSHTHLPLSLAWDTFGKGNGSDTYMAFKSSIMRYRNEKDDGGPDPIIGCIVLASPVFFDKNAGLFEMNTDIPAECLTNVPALAPPVRDTPHMRGYCPRCNCQYTRRDGVCADCEIELRPFQ